MTAMTSQPPLAQARIVGFTVKVFQPVPDAPRKPGGSCWHCGEAIMNCVLVDIPGVQGTQTIGTTCAERVGLDRKELRALLAEKYADERRTRSAAERRKAQEAWEARDAAETAEHGPHGTESRWIAGCTCDPCAKNASHGSTTRYGYGGCRCLPCVEAEMLARPMSNGTGHSFREMDVLVDLRTGEVVNARRLSGTWGPFWAIDGAGTVNAGPKRRATIAKKGYTEASAMFACYTGRSRDGGWFTERIIRVSTPLVDNWGEPIERPAAG